MKNSHVEKCQTMLKGIIRDPSCKPFLRSPRYDVSYCSIHKSLQPIDLVKVKERLDNHLYDSMDQFASDLCSVFTPINMKKLCPKQVGVCRKMQKRINESMKDIASSAKCCKCIIKDFMIFIDCHKWMYSLRNVRKHSKLCKFTAPETNEKGNVEQSKIESEEEEEGDEKEDKKDDEEKDEEQQDDQDDQEIKGNSEMTCYFKECDLEIKDDTMVEHNLDHIKCSNAIQKNEMKERFSSIGNFEENSDVCEFKNKLNEKWKSRNSIMAEMNRKKLSYHPELKCNDNTSKWTWPYSMTPLSLHYIE